MGGGSGKRLVVVVGGWIERELTVKRERERGRGGGERGDVCRGEGDIQFFFFCGRERSTDLS